MCIGIPMQIKETGFGYAICEGMGQRREVDMLLVGEQPIDTWVLVFLNSAREVLANEEAIKITNAVSALGHVMSDSVDHMADNQQWLDTMFADLVDREPPKPDSLIALENSRNDIKEENHGD